MRRFVLLGMLFVLVSGFSRPVPPASEVTPYQQIFMLKELKPDLERVGVIWSSDTARDEALVATVQRAAAGAGVKLFVAEADDISDVGPKYRWMINTGDIQALWIVQEDPLIAQDFIRDFLVQNTVKSGLPLLSYDPSWVEAGACVSVVKTNGKVGLVVNEAVARSLAITVPESYREQTQYLAAK